MRLHRHLIGKTVRWHSVRLRHEEVWDWCAHREEVERHLDRPRRSPLSLRAAKTFRLQAAH